MSRLDPYLSKGIKKSRVAKGEVSFPKEEYRRDISI